MKKENRDTGSVAMYSGEASTGTEDGVYSEMCFPHGPALLSVLALIKDYEKDQTEPTE